MLWLAILLPALPLQVFTRGVREAPPLAILSPRGRVLAASAAASAAGIEAGQRAASALALLPELRLQPLGDAVDAPLAPDVLPGHHQVRIAGHQALQRLIDQPGHGRRQRRRPSRRGCRRGP